MRALRYRCSGRSHYDVAGSPLEAQLAALYPRVERPADKDAGDAPEGQRGEREVASVDPDADLTEVSVAAQARRGFLGLFDARGREVCTRAEAVREGFVFTQYAYQLEVVTPSSGDSYVLIKCGLRSSFQKRDSRYFNSSVLDLMAEPRPTMVTKHAVNLLEMLASGERRIRSPRDAAKRIVNLWGRDAVSRHLLRSTPSQLKGHEQWGAVRQEVEKLLSVTAQKFDDEAPAGKRSLLNFTVKRKAHGQPELL